MAFADASHCPQNPGPCPLAFVAVYFKHHARVQTFLFFFSTNIEISNAKLKKKKKNEIIFEKLLQYIFIIIYRFVLSLDWTEFRTNQIYFVAFDSNNNNDKFERR